MDLLTSVMTTGLWIGGISATLGALISFTDKIVNNYGDLDIDINQGKKQLTVKGGASLLTTLAENGIYVPSACGGRGSCGACKCKVNSDVGLHLPTEMPYMNKEEIESNIRLSCQIKIKSNIAIEIPESLFNIRKLACSVVSIKSLTHDIKEVLLKLPDDTELPYEAGQYGQFEAPAYKDIKEPTQRAYSFSSHPQLKDHLEFLIRLVPGGIVTTYVHEHLKVGQSINVVAPVGDFHVRSSNAAMICVAGGSGMAPFKSIFNDMISNGTMGIRDIWYFFGARATRDMYYLDWLHGLDAQYEKFHFVPALSEPQPGETWNGPVGLITDVLGDYLDNKISKEQAKEGYLCGSPGMLDACMNVMQKKGMKVEDIFFDKFA